LKVYSIMPRCQASISDSAVSTSAVSSIFCAVFVDSRVERVFKEPTALKKAKLNRINSPINPLKQRVSFFPIVIRECIVFLAGWHRP